MDGLKGTHGAATALFGLLVLGFTYTFTNNLITSFNDSTIQMVSWVAYVMMVILLIGVVPALIVLRGSSNANIVSALIGYGIFNAALVVTNILYKIIGSMINSDATGNMFINFGQGSLPTQFLSLIFLIGLFLGQYLIPALVMVFPEIISNRLAGVEE